MTWYFIGAIIFCVGISMWALGEGKEVWSAFWALLALVNTMSCNMSLKPVPVEPE